MLYKFLAIVLVATAGMTFYYQYQNKGGKIGGSISKAKLFWLGFASFNYFIFPLFLFFQIHDVVINKVLLVIIVWFYLRFVIQGFLMFITKNWTPRYGVIHNISSIIVILTCMIYVLINNDLLLEGKLFIISFMTMLQAVVIVDNYYALQFHRIVGTKTKGDEAIWFAGNTKEFNRINKITKRNNWLFFILFMGVVLIMSSYA